MCGRSVAALSPRLPASSCLLPHLRLTAQRCVGVGERVRRARTWVCAARDEKKTRMGPHRSFNLGVDLAVPSSALPRRARGPPVALSLNPQNTQEDTPTQTQARSLPKTPFLPFLTLPPSNVLVRVPHGPVPVVQGRLELGRVDRVA